MKLLFASFNTEDGLFVIGCFIGGEWLQLLASSPKNGDEASMTRVSSSSPLSRDSMLKSQAGAKFVEKRGVPS